MPKKKTEVGTRVEILEAARRMLEARGYHGIGLDAIAREARVSRQAVYLHFQSKAGLLVALVEHIDATGGLKEHFAVVDRVKAGPKLLEVLVELIASYTPMIHAIATVLDTARRTDPDAEAAWENRMTDRRKGLRRAVARLDAEGLLAPGLSPEAATDLMWVLTSTRVWEDLVIARGWSKRRYVEHLSAVLRSAILARPPLRAFGSVP
jgi:AcrR family transcriptional regulator